MGEEGAGRASSEGVQSALLRALYGTLPAMLAYWDDGLRCRFANRAYERWFGVSADAMLGRDMKEFLGPLWELNRPYVEGVLRGEEQEFEREIADPAGGAPRFSHAFYLPDIVDGAVRGFTVLVIDISRRRHAELALETARDEAEHVSRELETFSYSVAHCLRAPLRGMNGFAELLSEAYAEKLDSVGRDWLSEISSSARTMAELIDAMLALARLSRTEITRERLDLSGMARDEVARLLANLPGREVELSIEAGLTVNADRMLVGALLTSLLENAIKYTSRRPVARIELGRATGEGPDAFFLRDNGAGFDMAYAAKLVAPFQRLHTVAEFPGTGIGLAIAQRIVQRHGGTLRGEGVVDGGATFFFSLGPAR